MTTSKAAIVIGLTILGLASTLLYLNPQDTIMRMKHDQVLSGINDLETRLHLFKSWTEKYNKSYGLSETHYRFAQWNKMYDWVQDHNSKGLSWEAECNQFADLTTEEFASIYTGFRGDLHKPENVVHLEKTHTNDVDWRKKGAVGPIEDQKQCGSCYSFSANGATVGLIFLTKGQLINLSEQQLVDCSSSYGNQGCNGGLMDNCFKYTKEKGMMLEADYPYTASAGSCKYVASKATTKVGGYSDVPANKPDQLKAATAKAPTSVAVQASETAFQSYKSGIISSGCGTQLDHAILNVGYSTAGGYWIVKNSWGSSWGEQGYVRIAMGTQNSGAGVCGINSSASYPTA